MERGNAALSDVLQPSRAVVEFRESQARSETPVAMRWGGTGFFVVNVLALPFDVTNTTGFIRYLLLAVMMVGAGIAMTQSWFQRRWITSVVGACAVVNTATFALGYLERPGALAIVYLYVIMIGTPSFVMSYRVMLWLAPVSVAIAWYAVWAQPDGLGTAGPAAWAVVSLSVEAAGVVIMVLRLRGLDALGRATREIHRLATRDSLTGVLNRHGLDLELPDLLGRKARTSGRIYACFVDVDGLKGANDVYGHEFGDAVLVTVADAVQATAPEHALIARWGGDEFLVLGPCPAPDIAAWTDTLKTRIAASGIDRSKWAGVVSLGIAEADTATCSIDQLIGQADEHMYQRRELRRGSRGTAR